MATDQQFCLRWNNHQSTLISVFDSLLENGTLVDCTLAAEGQYLKAHKVVLSACSPYLETLLSQHYEKHPIVILKDVKFTELKSMMDYMYRGEVNISQDQLGTFLKAAESLQIKGLSDNGDEATTGPTTKRQEASSRPSVTEVRNVESKRPAPSADLSDASREGSISPSSLRKRRRTRRTSQGDDPDSHLDTSNACDFPINTSQTTSLSVPSTTVVPTPVQNLPKQIVKQEPSISRIDNLNSTIPPESGLLKEKIEPPSEPLLEPKTEYLDYMNNENSIEVEDLTLDDDEELDSSMDASRPGPSHGDLSNQGYQWPMSGDQSGTDEIFMAAQQAVGAATGQQRDSQDGAQEIRETTKDILKNKILKNKMTQQEAIFKISEESHLNDLSQHDVKSEPNDELQESIRNRVTIYNDNPEEAELIVPDLVENSNNSSTGYLEGIEKDQCSRIRVIHLEHLGLKSHQNNSCDLSVEANTQSNKNDVIEIKSENINDNSFSPNKVFGIVEDTSSSVQCSILKVSTEQQLSAKNFINVTNEIKSITDSEKFEPAKSASKLYNLELDPLEDSTWIPASSQKSVKRNLRSKFRKILPIPTLPNNLSFSDQQESSNKIPTLNQTITSTVPQVSSQEITSVPYSFSFASPLQPTASSNQQIQSGCGMQMPPQFTISPSQVQDGHLAQSTSIPMQQSISSLSSPNQLNQSILSTQYGLSTPQFQNNNIPSLTGIVPHSINHPSAVINQPSQPVRMAPKVVANTETLNQPSAKPTQPDIEKLAVHYVKTDEGYVQPVAYVKTDKGFVKLKQVVGLRGKGRAKQAPAKIYDIRPRILPKPDNPDSKDSGYQTILTRRENSEFIMTSMKNNTKQK